MNVTFLRLINNVPASKPGDEENMYSITISNSNSRTIAFLTEALSLHHRI